VVTAGAESLGVSSSRFDDGAMRNFDGDVNRTRLSPSYTYEPRGHFNQARWRTGS
jgi:hypothetical protein